MRALARAGPRAHRTVPAWALPGSSRTPVLVAATVAQRSWLPILASTVAAGAILGAGWTLGVWAFGAFVPEARPVYLGAGGALLLLLQRGVGQIDAALQAALDALRGTPSPKTDGLARYVEGRQRLYGRARHVAAVAGVLVVAAAALLGIGELEKPSLPINAEIARAFTAGGVALLLLQLVLTGLVLRGWGDARPLEQAARKLARDEGDRLAWLAAQHDVYADVIPPLATHPLPVTYSDAGDQAVGAA